MAFSLGFVGLHKAANISHAALDGVWNCAGTLFGVHTLNPIVCVQMFLLSDAKHCRSLGYFISFSFLELLGHTQLGDSAHTSAAVSIAAEAQACSQGCSSLLQFILSSQILVDVSSKVVKHFLARDMQVFCG